MMVDYHDFSFLPETINRYPNWNDKPKPTFPALKPWETVAVLESVGWNFYRYVDNNNYNNRAMYGRNPDGVWYEYHGNYRMWFAIGYE